MRTLILLAVLCLANIASRPALTAEAGDFQLGSFYLVWLDADGAPVDWAVAAEVGHADKGG